MPDTAPSAMPAAIPDGKQITKPHAPFTLRLIAGLALVKSVLFAVGCFGIFHLVSHDIDDTLTAWLSAIHLDPTGERLHKLIGSIAGTSLPQLKLIGFGTMFYAVLYAVEGVGLWFDRTWAEWLTVVGSSLLLPVELYEMFVHLTMLKTSVFVINAAVVWYLVVRLRRKRTTVPTAVATPAPGVR